MAITTAIGSFTILTTDSGAKAITGLTSLGGATPQLVFIYHRQQTGTGSSTGSRYFGVGGFTSGQQFAITQFFEDNVAASNFLTRLRDTSCIFEIDSAGALTGEAVFSSFGSNAFTINIVNAFAADCDVEFVAIAGLTNVFIDLYQLPTALGAYQRTAPNFQPDAILAYGLGMASLDVATANARLSMGMLDASGAQFAIGSRLQDNATSNYLGGQAATDRLITFCTNDGTENPDAIKADDANWPDPTGYTLNRVVGTAANYVVMVCIKGGSPKVVNTTTRTSAGNFDVATAGRDPKVAYLLCRPDTVTSRTTPFENGEAVLGWGRSSTERFGIWQHDNNQEPLGATETYSRVSRTRILEHYDRTAADTLALAGDIDLVSMGAEKLTLNQNDADTQLSLLGVFVLGDAVAGGGIADTFYGRASRGVAGGVARGVG